MVILILISLRLILDPTVLDNSNEEEAQIAALLAQYLHTENTSITSVEAQSENVSNWKKNRR